MKDILIIPKINSDTGEVRRKEGFPYDIDTFYNRILKSPDVSEEKKHELHEPKTALCYPELLQKIRKLENKLDACIEKDIVQQEPEMIRLILLSFFFSEILNLIWIRFYFDFRRDYKQGRYIPE